MEKNWEMVNARKRKENSERMYGFADLDEKKSKVKKEKQMEDQHA